MRTLLIGESAGLRRVRAQIAKVAASSATVLVTGESGAGKELVAKRVHEQSPRARRPCVAVNCAALPDELLESELFGHRRGAYTGAYQDTLGLVRQADGGTLFLDEIGDMSPRMQTRLLRLLQNKVVLPLGAERDIPVDVRVVAATHRDLRAEVQAGRFRADLYYRLDVLSLHVPPLRERTEDIPLLIAHLQPRLRFSPEAMAMLQGRPWPGNVRELSNVLERLAALHPPETISATSLAPYLPAPMLAPCARSASDSLFPLFQLPPEGLDFYAAIEEIEARLIRLALDRTRGNQTDAAQLLRLNRTTLAQKLGRTLYRDGSKSNGIGP